MGILEEIKQQQDQLILQNNIIQQRLDKLNQSLDKSNQRILSYSDIMERLNLKNRKSFQRRMDELMEFGMYKEGQWRMREVDLDKYVESKRDIIPALRV